MNVSLRQNGLTTRPRDGQIIQATELAYPMQEIAAQIFSAGAMRGVRHIMLTGASPKVGTSFVTNGLADTLSVSGHRVLIIELLTKQADCMTLPRLLADPGMTLEHKMTLQVGRDEILTLVAPGSRVFEQVSLALLGRFDIVLWDLPPPGHVAPTAVAARLMDGVVLVVQDNSTTRRALGYATSRLRAHEARMLGVVMNRVRKRVPEWLDRLA